MKKLCILLSPLLLLPFLALPANAAASDDAIRTLCNWFREHNIPAKAAPATACAGVGVTLQTKDGSPTVDPALVESANGLRATADDLYAAAQAAQAAADAAFAAYEASQNAQGCFLDNSDGRWYCRGNWPTTPTPEEQAQNNQLRTANAAAQNAATQAWNDYYAAEEEAYRAALEAGLPVSDEDRCRYDNIGCAE